MPALRQAYMFPGFPRIAGQVYPVPHRGHHPPGGMFSHSYKDYVGVAFGYVDGPYRSGLEEAIGYVGPVQAVVRGLPDSAPCGSHIIGPGLGGDPGCGNAPATAIGTDITPFHSLVEGIGDTGVRRSLSFLCIQASRT